MDGPSDVKTSNTVPRLTHAEAGMECRSHWVLELFAPVRAMFYIFA